MRHCTRCGHANPHNGRFCTACGTELETPSSTRGPGAPHAPALSPGRRRLLRGSPAAAAVAVLIVVVVVRSWSSSGGAVPPGWSRFSGEAPSSNVACPPGWKFMSPEDITAKSDGALVLTEFDVFCMNTQDDTQVFEIAGFDVPKGDVREFLRREQPKDADLSKEERERVVSQKIYELAGGAASETIIDGWQEKRIHLKTKVVLLIIKGKGIRVTCRAQSREFDRVDRQVFQPMIRSLGGE